MIEPMSIWSSREDWRELRRCFGGDFGVMQHVTDLTRQRTPTTTKPITVDIWRIVGKVAFSNAGIAVVNGKSARILKMLKVMFSRVGFRFCGSIFRARVLFGIENCVLAQPLLSLFEWTPVGYAPVLDLACFERPLRSSLLSQGLSNNVAPHQAAGN